MPTGPLFPASNIFVFAKGESPDLMDPGLLAAMTGPQLHEWQQAFRPHEPVFQRDWHCRSVEDNEGETGEERQQIARDLIKAGIHELPPRWIPGAPVPTARQFLQNLYYTKPFYTKPFGR